MVFARSRQLAMVEKWNYVCASDIIVEGTVAFPTQPVQEQTVSRDPSVLSTNVSVVTHHCTQAMTVGKSTA